MTYTLIPGTSAVRRDEDGATIPDDPDNVDRQAFDAWRVAGNVPERPASEAPDRRGMALAALAASDRTVLRCYENGIAVPTEWIAYRRALRAVAAGDEAGTVERPAYPPEV